jgi:hypothetical protein
MIAAEARVARAIRAATAGVLGANLLIAPRQLALIGMVATIPVDDPFFPGPLRAPTLLAFGWILPLLSAIPALVRPRSAWATVHGSTLLFGSAVLLVHQGTYFFATWVVDFWIGAFLLWLARAGRRDPVAACRSGPFLVQLLIAFWFLGGAAGKWTWEWWTGDAARELLVLSQRTHTTQLLVRLYGSDTAAIGSIGTCTSRISVMVETALAAVIFLPARPAFAAAAAVAVGMWLVVSYNLFEIMWPIVGIAAAGWSLLGDDE